MLRTNSPDWSVIMGPAWVASGCAMASRAASQRLLTASDCLLGMAGISLLRANRLCNADRRRPEKESLSLTLASYAQKS